MTKHFIRIFIIIWPGDSQKFIAWPRRCALDTFCRGGLFSLLSSSNHHHLFHLPISWKCVHHLLSHHLWDPYHLVLDPPGRGEVDWWLQRWRGRPATYLSSSLHSLQQGERRAIWAAHGSCDCGRNPVNGSSPRTSSCSCLPLTITRSCPYTIYTWPKRPPTSAPQPTTSAKLAHASPSASL